MKAFTQYSFENTVNFIKERKKNAGFADLMQGKGKIMNAHFSLLF